MRMKTERRVATKQGASVGWRIGIRSRLWIWAIALGFLTGCGTVSTYKVQYLGVPRYAPTDWKQVQILQSFPNRPYEKLGEVVASVSVNPEPSAEKIERALRRRAAELGAEAVVLIKDRIEETGIWWGGPRWAPVATPIHSRVIVGVAIRYKDGERPYKKG